MKQPDTQREGPAQKLDQDAAGEQPMGGREATTSGGGEPPHNTTKPATNKPNKKGGEAPQHKRQHTKAKEKTTAKTQAEKPTDQKRHRGATAKKKGNKKTTNKQRARKARPKTTKTGVPEGDRTTDRQAKEAPQDNSKWEQVTKRCQGKSGTGGRRNVKEIERERGA